MKLLCNFPTKPPGLQSHDVLQSKAQEVFPPKRKIADSRDPNYSECRLPGFAPCVTLVRDTLEYGILLVPTFDKLQSHSK